MNKAGTPSMEELFKKKQAYEGKQEGKYTFTIQELQAHLFKPEDNMDSEIKREKLIQAKIKSEIDSLKLARLKGSFVSQVDSITWLEKNKNMIAVLVSIGIFALILFKL